MELTHLAQHISKIYGISKYNGIFINYVNNSKIHVINGISISQKSMELEKFQVPSPKNLPTKIAPAGGKESNSSDPGVVHEGFPTIFYGPWRFNQQNIRI
jgi:hypothetical protein